MNAGQAAPLDPISTPLPWQRRTWEALLASAGNDRLPHALLVSGEEGSGRRRFVTAFSRFMLCQSPVHGSNCGECKTCALSQVQGHSDWRWIAPAGKSRSIGVDQIREVIRFTTQTSALGKYKVLVLHPADSMTIAAANAFLKCLEEPAANTLIMLVVRSASGIPPTIRSRCQQVLLPTPDREAALSWLALVSGDATLARRALEAADGMPLSADILLQGEDTLEEAERRRSILTELFQGRGNPAEAATVLGAMDAGDASSALLSQIHAYLRELPASRLRQPQARALLSMEGRLRETQRAMAGGATPQRDLLASAWVARLEEILGADAAG